MLLGFGVLFGFGVPFLGLPPVAITITTVIATTIATPIATTIPSCLNIAYPRSSARRLAAARASSMSAYTVVRTIMPSRHS